MAQLKFRDKTYTVAEGATVLDTLLEQGQDVPNSCRAGVCQSCLMQVVEGEVPEQAQKGLKDSYRARGLFLACRCQPEADLAVNLPDAGQLRVSAEVTGIRPLGHDVVELSIRTGTPFEYQAGQFVTLWLDPQLGRSYSIASLPDEDNTLVFHIRKIARGEFSTRVHEDLKVGDCLSVQGPAGDCFYLPGQPEQDILLIGTGTGLAPLLGIVHDALRHGHQGKLQLIHGALQPSGLYYHESLKALAARHDTLSYHPCVLNGEDGMDAAIRLDSVEARVRALIPKPAGWKAYLCGDPEQVARLRKQLFLAGCNMKDIHADAFVPSTPADRTG